MRPASMASISDRPSAAAPQEDRPALRRAPALLTWAPRGRIDLVRPWSSAASRRPLQVVPEGVRSNKDRRLPVRPEKGDEPGEPAGVDAEPGDVGRGMGSLRRKGVVQLREEVLGVSRRDRQGKRGPARQGVRPRRKDDQLPALFSHEAVDEGLQGRVQLGGPASQDDQGLGLAQVFQRCRLPGRPQLRVENRENLPVSRRLEGSDVCAAQGVAENRAAGPGLLRREMVRREQGKGELRRGCAGSRRGPWRRVRWPRPTRFAAGLRPGEAGGPTASRGFRRLASRSGPSRRGAPSCRPQRRSASRAAAALARGGSRPSSPGRSGCRRWSPFEASRRGSGP